MNITYKSTKILQPKDLQELFLSVEWSSGKQPEKLAEALKNYGSIFTAWDNEKLVGLIGTMDDQVLTAYVHYLCVNPTHQKQGIGRELIRLTKEYYKNYKRIILISYNKQVKFYEKCGLAVMSDCSPLHFEEVKQ